MGDIPEDIMVTAELANLRTRVQSSFAEQVKVIARAILAERERCYRHATAPHYGELTQEAGYEAQRIASRIRDGN